MKYSLKQLLLLVSLSALAACALMSANLPFVFTVSCFLFAINLISPSLALRAAPSRNFWIGFALVSWGVQLMPATLSFISVLAILVSEQHGYVVNVVHTGGMKPNESYFSSYYPSGASAVYSSLIIQIIALLLGIAAGIIASYGHQPLTKNCTEAADDASPNGQSLPSAR